LQGATLCYMDTRAKLDVRIIGDRVTKRRIALRLEQGELAEQAGLSRAYISRLESGVVPNPKLLDLERVAVALDLPLSTLTAPELTGQELHFAEVHGLLERIESEHGDDPAMADAIAQMLCASLDIRRARRSGAD
jgi:transcriptional regulator with XRE-family HTH domain